MPELPEVEAIARALRPLIEGRKIRCVHVLHPIATKPQNPAHLARMAQGRQILSVQRKGKYLWLELSRGILSLHFKLDGQLLWFSNLKKMYAVANKPGSGFHVDVAFELNNG
ncbi:MAG: DNA-formamidopyrimidine glycosylase family protein, partial [Candidatus Acidiferrum sp.]